MSDCARAIQSQSLSSDRSFLYCIMKVCRRRKKLLTGAARWIETCFSLSGFRSAKEMSLFKPSDRLFVSSLLSSQRRINKSLTQHRNPSSLWPIADNQPVVISFFFFSLAYLNWYRTNPSSSHSLSRGRYGIKNNKKTIRVGKAERL